MLLFSTDIDGTIYDGPEAADRFADFWDEVRGLAQPPLLSYNTGRSREDARRLIADTNLPEPEYLISGVGTQIYDWRAGNDLGEWREELTHGWNFDEVESLVRSHIHDIEMQGAEHQNPFKCSWYWDDRTREDLDRLNELLIEAGLRAQIVYSSRRDLDILPEKANKGNAISWLAGFLGIPFARIAVAGDSGNDASMFFVDDVHGIIVGNAESALPAAASGADIFHSARPCVEGVIEGLSRHLELDRPSHS